jgi:hypothetical protein
MAGGVCTSPSPAVSTIITNGMIPTLRAKWMSSNNIIIAVFFEI